MTRHDLDEEFSEEPDMFNLFPSYRKNKKNDNLDVVILDKAAAFIRSEEWEKYELIVTFFAKKIANGIHYRDIQFESE